MFSRRIKDGLLAGGLHLLLSLLIATFVFLLVRRTWFVPPWGQLMDGDSLLAMVIGIDVICGPLLTGLVVHSAKVRWKNVLDISVIASVQMAALVFGLWTAWQAKPSWLVFEGDRFVVVRYADLLAPDGQERFTFPKPPLVGLTVKAVSNLAGDDPAYLPSLSLSLQGIPPAYRPERWVDYMQAVPAVKVMAQHRPDWLNRLQTSDARVFGLKAVDAPMELLTRARFVPMQVGWHTDWVVLVDPASFLPLAVMQADAWAEPLQK